MEQPKQTLNGFDISDLKNAAYIKTGAETELRTEDNRLVLAGSVVEEVQARMLSHLDDVLGPADAQAAAARDDFSRSLVLELFSRRDSLNPSTFAALQEAQAAANVLEAYNALELASDALHSDDVDLKRFAVAQLAEGMIEAVTSEASAVTLQTAEAQQAVLSVSGSSKKAFALNLAMMALEDVSESPTSAPKALDQAASAVTQVFQDDGKAIAGKLMDVKELVRQSASSDAIEKSIEDAQSAIDAKLDSALEAATYEYRVNQELQAIKEAQVAHSDKLLGALGKTAGDLESASQIADFLTKEEAYFDSPVSLETTPSISGAESDLDLEAD
jgi:hypothetical protein